MGLLAFSLTLALAADASPAADSPRTVGSVLVTRRSGLTVAQAAELRGQLERALVAAGVPLDLEGKALASRLAGLGVKDPAACNGRRSCVLELARQLGRPELVSASISRVDGDSAIALELIRVEGDTTLAKDSFVAPKGTKELATLVAAFAESVKKALAPPVAQKVEPPPTPPPAVLVPTEPPPAPLVQVAPAPPPRSHTTGLVLGGAGVAAAIAGGALLAVSFATRATLTGGTERGAYTVSNSGLTEREAQERATQADTLLVAGSAAAAVGAGLLVGGVIAW